MRTRLWGYIALLAAFHLSTASAAGKCQLQQLGVLPVDMQGLRPLVWTKINGVKARFVLDSGAFYSTISRDAAAQYRLTVTAAPANDFYITGLGDLYVKLGDYPSALEQIDEWLDHHPLNSEQAVGLNDRCYTRATADRDLQQALADCNRALALRPYAQARTGTLVSNPLVSENPAFLDSRGLVYLRLGRLKDAIRDYDSALQVNSNMPTSLYGRALAELRLGEKAQGQNDLAAAEKLDGGVAKQFAGMGLAP